MKESIANEAREMAERLRELLDDSTPGPWAGVHGMDRRRDRGASRPGDIESEFASSKRVICRELTAPDKAFILYARNHFGRIAELLDLLAGQGGAAAAPADSAPAAAVAPPAAESAPAEPVPTGELDDDYLEGNGIEIDLSMLDDEDAAEIAETLKQLEQSKE